MTLLTFCEVLPGAAFVGAVKKQKRTRQTFVSSFVGFDRIKARFYERQKERRCLVGCRAYLDVEYLGLWLGQRDSLWCWWVERP